MSPFNEPCLRYVLAGCAHSEGDSVGVLQWLEVLFTGGWDRKDRAWHLSGSDPAPHGLPLSSQGLLVISGPSNLASGLCQRKQIPHPRNALGQCSMLKEVGSS